MIIITPICDHHRQYLRCNHERHLQSVIITIIINRYRQQRHQLRHLRDHLRRCRRRHSERYETSVVRVFVLVLVFVEHVRGNEVRSACGGRVE